MQADSDTGGIREGNASHGMHLELQKGVRLLGKTVETGAPIAGKGICLLS